MTRNLIRSWIGLFVAALFLSGQPARADLIGVNRTTGNLYSVSEVNASTSLIGSTGLAGTLADIQFAPNSTLYGFTDAGAATPSLYTINPNTAAVSLVGPLNPTGFVFEGALAFTPGGTAYAMNMGANGSAELFTINLTTGAATSLGVVSGATDINGLAYRSDGNLVGLDDNTNSLLVIDPLTLIATTLAAVPTTVGAVGGMTIDNGVGYYATGGPIASGSDSLYSFNLFTGVSTFVGNLGFADRGLSGLAAEPTSSTVPEPGSMLLLGSGLALLGVVRRRRAKENFGGRAAGL
jgi:hypothetical protein